MVKIPVTPVKIDLTYNNYNRIYINGVPVYTFYVKCIDYNAIPNEANVRTTSESAPYKSMISSLRSEPDKFFFKNGGINVIANEVVINETQSKVTLSFEKDYGILNGGHTQKAILDCKEQYSIDPSAIVRIEVIKWSLDNKTIAELATAKNSSCNVKSYSDANKKGLFEPLKREMKPVYEQKITWYENEPVDGKPMPSIDLIAILNMFDIDRYNKIEQPNSSANGPGNVFESWKKSNENGEGRLVSVYPLVNDILNLYEYIQSTFNKDIKNGLTKMNVINRPKSDKTAYTIFTNKKIDFVLPKQILMPMLGSMRANLRYEGKKLVWIVEPTKLFDVCKQELTTNINQYLKQNDINKLSKDPGAWSAMYNIVLIKVLESQGSRL